MAELTHEQYDELERAIRDRTRIAVWRRGTEYVVIPRRLRLVDGREVIEAVHPTTGDEMGLPLDALDRIEVVR